MYLCLQAWGLQLRLKVRSVCMCVCVIGGGGGDNTGGEGRARGRLFQPSVSCEMKAEGFALLMPGIR